MGASLQTSSVQSPLKLGINGLVIHTGENSSKLTSSEMKLGVVAALLQRTEIPPFSSLKAGVLAPAEHIWTLASPRIISFSNTITLTARKPLAEIIRVVFCQSEQTLTGAAASWSLGQCQAPSPGAACDSGEALPSHLGVPWGWRRTWLGWDSAPKKETWFSWLLTGCRFSAEEKRQILFAGAISRVSQGWGVHPAPLSWTGSKPSGV